MQQDLYATLGVPPDATPDQIRRAYRARAFDLHPDRNGGSAQAEEGFKRLTAAYAVLGDPERRARYDAARGSDPGTGTAFDPGEMFADLFRNPAFADLFAQMSGEFGRQGLRFDETYLRQVFSGRRGGVVFGGVVFAGSLGELLGLLGRRSGPAPQVARGARRDLPSQRPGRFGRWLRGALPRARSGGGRGRDLHYTLPVAASTLQSGGEVRLRVPGPHGEETYAVRIPAGSRPGARLRLRGRGAGGGPDRGDLLLELRGTA